MLGDTSVKAYRNHVESGSRKDSLAQLIAARDENGIALSEEELVAAGMMFMIVGTSFQDSSNKSRRGFHRNGAYLDVVSSDQRSRHGKQTCYRTLQLPNRRRSQCQRTGEIASSQRLHLRMSPVLSPGPDSGGKNLST